MCNVFLPTDIILMLVAFLDVKTACRFSVACHLFNGLTRAYVRFYQSLDNVSRTKDVYGLFAMSLPRRSGGVNQEPLRHYFKKAMVLTLDPYTFINTEVLLASRERGYKRITCNLLKLVGADCIFKITPDAARVLCLVLQDTTHIDSFIFTSQPNERDKRSTFNPRDSFGDDIATIFATNLPRNRFRLLYIAGGFGQNGTKVLLENVLSFMCDVYDAESKDTFIKGLMQYQLERSDAEWYRQQLRTHGEESMRGSHLGTNFLGRMTRIWTP